MFNSDGSVTYLDRHGIRIVFAQTGSIGVFNPIAFILNLVAALALFKVATLLVDSIMIYCLPRKEMYYKAKYAETENFNGDLQPQDNKPRVRDSSEGIQATNQIAENYSQPQMQPSSPPYGPPQMQPTIPPYGQPIYPHIQSGYPQHQPGYAVHPLYQDQQGYQKYQ